MKKALITGITGQDGSYLAELLLSKGYEVHGVIRRASTVNTKRIDHLFPPEGKGFIHYGDLEEGLGHLLLDINPDEIYNLAAMNVTKRPQSSTVIYGPILGKSIEVAPTGHR